MNDFEQFKALHGPPLDIRAVPRKIIEHYRSILPLSIIRFWEETGWCSYANGFFFIDNPDEFLDVLDDWIDFSGTISVIVHTAIGHFFIWYNGSFYLLNVHAGQITKITDDVGILFNTVLCDKDVLCTLKKELFDDAVPRLGRPKPDECFAFVPALPIGGIAKAENLQRVTLSEHLNILSQIMKG